ncbi:uncharacterized protein LOC112557456 [Pomacea canaliculata]|uniref:uncharacterized protein LOC112557456 n=1 Tax=Pomacea canaliculata TaxID=400727 RepID=UPI000D736B92|nr:uncharacterized protein LOC112557456 [Pomacea canaliculata]
MTTLSTFLVLCLLVGVSQAASLRQLIGVCAELCPEAGCPTGYVCHSNGCGHQCYPSTSVIDCRLRPVCALFCANGYARGSDGCPLCACLIDGVVAE